MPWTFYNASGQKLSTVAGYKPGGTDVAVADGGTNLSVYAVGDVVYASGTTVLAKLAKPGTPAGEVLTFAACASAPSWAAAGVSGLGTLEGAQLTESTTTSTSAADMSAITSICIAPALHIVGKSLHRKTTGAVSCARGGLKMNCTVLQEAVTGGAIGTGILGLMADTNAAYNGFAEWRVPATVTNYAVGGANGFANFGGGGYATYAGCGDRPTAAITSITTRGIVANASVTWGQDEVGLFSWNNS